MQYRVAIESSVTGDAEIAGEQLEAALEQNPDGAHSEVKVDPDRGMVLVELVTDGANGHHAAGVAQRVWESVMAEALPEEDPERFAVTAVPDTRDQTPVGAAAADPLGDLDDDAPR